MNLTKKQALIYCRVSSKKQEHLGGGLTSQEKRCRDYAKINDYEVAQIFQDSFSGGGDFMKRPAMRDLFTYVDTNKNTEFVVIFDDLKRFARDLEFHWKLRKEFRSRNLIPKCLNFNFEETAEGFFIETVIAAQGELEREQNKRQVEQKMQARLERGIYCFGGIAPLGYTYEKNKEHGGKVLSIHPQEAKVIRDAFIGFASGNFFHIKDVIEYIRTRPELERGKNLHKDTAKAILTCVLYAGYIEYPSWNISRRRAVHEPIISLELFEQVQERLFGKSPIRTRKDMREDFPLRGLVFCKHCKRPFTASWSTGRSKKYPFYRCTNLNCPVRNKGISRDVIHLDFEEYMNSIGVNEEVLKLLEAITIREVALQEKNALKYVESLQQELKTLEMQKSSFLTRLIKTTDEELLSIYEEQIKVINNRLLLIEEKLSNPNDTILENLEPAFAMAREVLENPYKYWNKEGLELKKLLIQTLFLDKLEYDENTGFGTDRKCYAIRFSEEYQAKKNLNFRDVHTTSTNWNHETLIAKSARKRMPRKQLEEFAECIKKIAVVNGFVEKERKAA